MRGHVRGRWGCAVGALWRRVAIVAPLMTACVLSRQPQAVAPSPDAAPVDAGLAAHSDRVGWGVIRYREVGVTGARFTLEAARGCDEVPAPLAGRDVVLGFEAERVGCRVRPWHGRVSVAVRDADGAWVDLPPLRSDREGRVSVRFAELERAARSGNSHRPLADYTALRVGRGGWAGTYDLARLRELQADVHATWIGRGRGVPALFAALHPSHPRAAAIAGLAIEARLARQEQDFAAIERGELGAAAFLDRHVWSPLRVRVAAMLTPQRGRDDDG